MRRYTPAVLAALGIGALLLTATPAAAGGTSFSIGAGFQVGGISFHVAYGRPGYGAVPYYYRTPTPIHHRGHACSTQCFRSSGFWYHTPFCPLVGVHFSSFGFYGGPFFESAWVNPFRPYRYRGHGHYRHGFIPGPPSHFRGYGYWGGHSGRWNKGHGGRKGYRGSGHYGSGSGHQGGGRYRAPGTARRTRPPRP